MTVLAQSIEAKEASVVLSANQLRIAQDELQRTQAIADNLKARTLELQKRIAIAKASLQPIATSPLPNWAGLSVSTSYNQDQTNQSVDAKDVSQSVAKLEHIISQAQEKIEEYFSTTSIAASETKKIETDVAAREGTFQEFSSSFSDKLTLCALVCQTICWSWQPSKLR